MFDRRANLHQVLRQRICLLDYAPGTRLSETDLAQEFGTSRTPLRRALALEPGAARGEEPDGYAVSPKDLYATVLHALGADTEASLTTPDGRPIRVVDGDAEPVQRILA